MTCHVFGPGAIGARCAACHADLDRAHFVGERELLCAACCPLHGAQASLDWEGPVRSTDGQQEALF